VSHLLWCHLTLQNHRRASVVSPPMTLRVTTVKHA